MIMLYDIILLELDVHFNLNSFPYPFIISFKSNSTYPYLSNIYIFIIIGNWLGLVESVAFSRDGRYLATGSDDKTVNLINLEYILCNMMMKYI